MKTEAVENGVRFTETECGIDYLSTDKHQHGNVPSQPTDPSSWCIDREAEATSFCAAVGDQPDGQAPTSDLWFMRRTDTGLVAFGTADEKIALFQQPSNEFDGWHGHPRGHRGRADYPDVAILRSYKDGGILNNVEYKRMINGMIP